LRKFGYTTWAARGAPSWPLNYSVIGRYELMFNSQTMTGGNR